DAVEDLLRAVRAEIVDARPPWRATRAAPTQPLRLSIGDADLPPDAAPAPPTFAGSRVPGPVPATRSTLSSTTGVLSESQEWSQADADAAARTDRAAAV